MSSSPYVRKGTVSMEIDGDEPATERSPMQPSLPDDTSPITAHLLDWQATGEEACLERLCVTILPIAHRMITATLQRLGIHDPSAIDDALSLVLDHLRRLPLMETGDRPVARFAPHAAPPRNHTVADPGLAFVVWLARERAADVGRAWRRRNKHATVFSMLDQQASNRVHEYAATRDDAPSTELCLRLREAIPQLQPRERVVVELLLAGKSQAVIAHMLDVCEGTVSRLRARAIASLRDLIAE